MKFERKYYEYCKHLKIGIIQTTVDCDTAWQESGKEIGKMNYISEQYVINELRKGFKDLEDMNERPQIVLLPEYTIPHGAVKQLEKYACSLGTVIIGGMDLYHLKDNFVQNNGIIIIPNEWPEITYSNTCQKKYFGKKYYAETELETAKIKKTNYYLYLYNRKTREFRIIQNPYNLFIENEGNNQWIMEPQVYQVKSLERLF